MQKTSTLPATPPPSVWYKRSTFWAPALAVAFGLLWFAGTARSPSEPADEFQLSKFGKLPVLDGGRMKPIDSFANVQLMGITKRQNYYQEYYDEKKKDADGRPSREVIETKRRPAVHWLLNLMAESYVAKDVTVRMPPAMAKGLGLADSPTGHYQPQEVIDAINENKAVSALLVADPAKLEPQQAMVASMLKEVVLDAEKKRGKFEEVLAARKKNGAPEQMRVFRIENDQVTAMLRLEKREGLRYTFEEIALRDREQRQAFQDFRLKALSAYQRPEKERDLTDVKALELYKHFMTQSSLMELDGDMLLVPTSDPDVWKTMKRAIRDGDLETNPAAKSLDQMLSAYARGDVKTFNSELDKYTTSLEKEMPAAMTRVRLEAWFNHFAPFYQCLLMYVVVLLLAIGSWIGWTQQLRRAAFALAILTAAVHTFALIMRIYLTQRPPVTNLYSSAVFIGWGCVLLCLYLEYVAGQKRFARSMALAVAAILGFATMIVAHHLGTTGDTLEVMQAVLDTNFWLATHVTTVTLGYAATFGAGFLAILFVFLMLATAVRSFFATREPLAGSELAWFVASVCGLMAMPAGVMTVVLGGLWMLLWGDGSPLDFGTILFLSVPGVAVGGFCSVLIISKRLSGDYGNAELPKVVHVVDALALRQETAKVLSGLVYGVVCFAMLLSFVGTVLGGIWADQSWGRFWGWDPKENGALLIVIMNALILHARWGGIVKERGLCVLAILGNMVTAWSWFGTNQLGVGLHAYGFNNTLAFGCTVFWISQLCMVGLAAMPLRFWRAYAEGPLEEALAKPTKAPRGPRLQSGRSGNTGIQPA